MRLHRTPRKNSCAFVSAALCSIIQAIASPGSVPGAVTPEKCTRAAKTIAPSRLPTMVASSTTPARPQVIVRRSAPCVRYIIEEVASSAPATTTIVSATPNTRPCTSGAHGEPAIVERAAGGRP